MDFKIEKLPKVELHVHLDCCLSYEASIKIDPGVSLSTFKEKFIGTSCSCLKDYIKCADNALEYMQSKEQLEIVVEDLFNQFKEDNIVYAEVRFAPLLHINNGLSSREVVEIISNKTKLECLKSEIDVGLILCTLRHFTEEQSLETVNLVHQFSNENIVGFDIAADEAGFPLDNHIKAFEFAHKNNIYCTAHAGEALGAESVKSTLKNLKPHRIGHGVRCIEDNLLLEKSLKIDLTIALDVDNNSLIDRLLERGKSSGRADDQSVEKINMRLQEYDNKTKPLIEYYNDQNKFYSINGIGSLEQITSRIVEVIEDYNND